MLIPEHLVQLRDQRLTGPRHHHGDEHVDEVTHVFVKESHRVDLHGRLSSGPRPVHTAGWPHTSRSSSSSSSDAGSNSYSVKRSCQSSTIRPSCNSSRMA